MNQKQHITILSGGGSPHSEEYGPVYRLIEEEATSRGVTTQLVDYVGVGHAPEYGMGLNLPGAVEKARKEITERPIPNASTLLCRSFGCNVGAYLLAHHGDEMAAFSRIILWGPSSFHLLWTLAGCDRGGLDKVNFHSLSKGVQWSPTYWKTCVPIEESIRLIKGIAVDVGFGSKDKYCAAPFADYLAALIRTHTDCQAKITEIEGAAHEIRPTRVAGTSPEDHERIKREYFHLIFRENQKSGSLYQES